MNPLIEFFERFAPQISVLTAFASLLAIGYAIAIGRSLRRSNQKWRELLTGPSGRDLEELLLAHLRDKERLAAEIERLKERVDVLENKMRSAKRRLGLVRYDAFEDVGGAQSFALALYDEEGDGAVLTSVVGRADCRVFCKPLVGGRSERNLSQEEQRAIQEARSSGPKTIIS